MTSLRTALLAPLLALAIVAGLVHLVLRHGGASGLLGAFVAAVVLGSSSALAIVLVEAASAGPRRPAREHAPVRAARGQRTRRS